MDLLAARFKTCDPIDVFLILIKGCFALIVVFRREGEYRMIISLVALFE
jgi:hypothetical protein